MMMTTKKTNQRWQNLMVSPMLLIPHRWLTSTGARLGATSHRRYTDSLIFSANKPLLYFMTSLYILPFVKDWKIKFKHWLRKPLQEISVASHQVLKAPEEF